MKIGVELRQIAVGSTGGISVHLKGILETLFSRYPNHEFILFSTIFNRGLLESIPDHVKVLTIPTFSFFSEMDQTCTEEGIQILFRSYPMEEDLNFPLSKQVFLIPDIQHELFEEFFSPEVLRVRRAAFNRALSRAGAIGTNSEYTRKTLLTHKWTRCKDIFVMNPALPTEHRKSSLSDLTPEEQSFLPDNDFFLYPANLWPHKNHRRILKAFEFFLKKKDWKMQFVFTGHPDGWPELQAEFPALPIQHLGFVRPQLLNLLLQKAKALVFLSLYEGFGIPLLEAFNAGTPVICSNTTSLPEVGGDAVLTCDPTDIDAISVLMAQVVEEQKVREKLVLEGKKRLQSYSWEHSANNLFKAFQRVAEKSENEISSTPSAVIAGDPPLVSIVTPPYNQGRFLRRTIESVLSQDYSNIEYIVIDGGSKDESFEILKSYGNRFNWVFEPDNGQADAINKGFALSRGEIRAYLNSDDVLSPDAVGKVVEHFQNHPEIDLLYGRANYIDEEDRVTGPYNTADYSFARLMRDCCICQPAAFWRTRIARKVGPFNDRLHCARDYEYWLRIDRSGGGIKHIHDILACSRLYPETKTLSTRRQIYQEVFQICQELGGYVDLDYFYGLWHHLTWEQKNGWRARLRWLPKFYEFMAVLHCLWYHRHQHPLKNNILSLGLKIKNRVLDRLPLVPSTYRLLWPVTYRVTGRRPVFGFWADNWLGPICCIFLKKGTIPQKWRLAGIAPIDMTLILGMKGHTLGTYALRAGQYETIFFDVSPELGQRLILRFSNHIVDAVHRRLSFRLMDTNLFSEYDTL